MAHSTLIPLPEGQEHWHRAVALARSVDGYDGARLRLPASTAGTDVACASHDSPSLDPPPTCVGDEDASEDEDGEVESAQYVRADITAFHVRQDCRGEMMVHLVLLRVLRDQRRKCRNDAEDEHAEDEVESLPIHATPSVTGRR